MCPLGSNQLEDFDRRSSFNSLSCCSQQNSDWVLMRLDQLMWKAHAASPAEFKMHSFKRRWQQTLGRSLFACTMLLIIFLFRSKVIPFVDVSTVEAWTWHSSFATFPTPISFPYFRHAHKLLLLDSARIQYHLRWTELHHHLFPDSKESAHFLGNPSLSIWIAFKVLSDCAGYCCLFIYMYKFVSWRNM